jgi:hypothetical protein
MNRREERQLLGEVYENNIMLHQLCQVVNTYLSRYNQENEDDFGRNVLANLVSGMVDIRGIYMRRL